MTDVVEAMARGMWEAADTTTLAWDKLSEATRDRMRNHARAAIRAVTEAGGLVVGKMPEDAPHPASVTGYAAGVLGGYNTALRQVRAAAVEVEGE